MESTKTYPSNPAYREIMAVQQPNSIYHFDDNRPDVAMWRKRQAIEASNLPLRHVLAMDGLEPTGAWQTAQQRLRASVARGGIIALLGIRGTGKTQMAVDMALVQVLNRQRVCYRKSADLFREIRAAMKAERKAEDELIRRCVAYSLLIVDEAHERGESDFENRVLTGIVDGRYDRMLPLIFIANQTREEFARAMGPSIVSRMHECGEVIECNWASFRGVNHA